MNAAESLREKVIATALAVAAGRAVRENREPWGYDDAQAEVEMDLFREALENWRDFGREA